MNLNAPVGSAPGFGGVILDGTRQAVALRLQARRVDAAPEQVAHHAGGALLGQLHIIGSLAATVGMALNSHMNLGIIVEHVGDLIEQRITRRQDIGFRRPEVDALIELDLVILDLDQFALHRAAVIACRAGDHRAFVDQVGDAVAVIIVLGATVLILVAVEVLGLVGALVVDIRNAVEVPVIIRATVEFGRAGNIRALIVDVEHAVAVIIGVGTSVFILESVEVLGIIGALVDVVGNAVAVTVSRGGRNFGHLDLGLLDGHRDRLVATLLEIRENIGLFGVLF